MPSRIEFLKIRQALYGIYVVSENGKSVVNDNFFRLPEKDQDPIKALIVRMSEIEKYQSPKIKYNLSGYNYGEIRPMPHRFFFFQKCGNNYIFFDYIQKKVDSLPDNVYKQLNEKKMRYEKEFEKQFLQGTL